MAVDTECMVSDDVVSCVWILMGREINQRRIEIQEIRAGSVMCRTCALATAN